MLSIATLTITASVAIVVAVSGVSTEPSEAGNPWFGELSYRGTAARSSRREAAALAEVLARARLGGDARAKLLLTMAILDKLGEDSDWERGTGSDAGASLPIGIPGAGSDAGAAPPPDTLNGASDGDETRKRAKFMIGRR